MFNCIFTQSSVQRNYEDAPGESRLYKHSFKKNPIYLHVFSVCCFDFHVVRKKELDKQTKQGNYLSTSTDQTGLAMFAL